MIDFSEAREQILKVGIDDIIEGKDKTEISFVLKNGQTITLYTTELEVDYTNPSGYADGTCFVQSEVRFMKGDLA